MILSSAVAIKRGLDFIYRFGSRPLNFDHYGSFLVCCFALAAATSRDPQLRQQSRSRAQEFARRWLRAHRSIPVHPTPEALLDFVLVCYALERIGLRNPALTEQVRTTAQGFTALDLLGFDPLNEPPPNDLPFTCVCGLRNQRGRKYCKQCRRRLLIQSRYRVWMEALANTYVAERCSLRFGSGYADVLKWLPAMRPYPVDNQNDDEFLRDVIYAVTHIVYTLNDYGTYKLSPRWLPLEFAFLKQNVEPARVRRDPEILGELLDSLKAFGLSASHPLIVRGTTYLLSEQNDDGSWGDPEEDDVRTRCHTTWTAIDGLRTGAWRGERLSFPRVKSLLK